MLQTDKPLQDLTAVKAAVDKLLGQYFAEKKTLAEAVGDSYVRLWQTMQHLNQAGGKRLRPYMVTAGYRAWGGSSTQDVLPVAAAWELLHLCMLIHDDIIDNDHIRYGIKNVAGSYENFYLSLEDNTSRREHLATSAAILAGDLAHSGAYDIILKSSLSAEQKILAQRYISAATFSVAGGELLDTESVLYPIDGVDPLSIAKFKTASYSFVGPLSTGAALAGASNKQLDTLEQYATALGCAFQLVDDILGMFGDESAIGKSTTGDIREGKRTCLMQYAFSHAVPADKKTLAMLVGKVDISEKEADIVRDIVIRSGARQAVETNITAYEQDCHNALKKLSQEGIATDDLVALITVTTRRSI